MDSILVIVRAIAIGIGAIVCAVFVGGWVFYGLVRLSETWLWQWVPALWLAVLVLSLAACATWGMGIGVSVIAGWY